MDKVVSYVNPFTLLVTGGDEVAASQLAGQLANAFVKSKDPLAEARALYEKAGLTYDSAIAGINKLKVDDQTKNVYRSTIDQIGLRGAETSHGTEGGAAGQADELARIRASTQGFIHKMQQDSAAQQAASKNAVKQAAEQQTSSYRSGLLNDLLAKNTQPTPFPRPQGGMSQSPVLQNLGIQKIPTAINSQPKPAVENPKFAGQGSSMVNSFNGALAKILGR